MTSRLYYSVAIALGLVVMWAAQAQTIGHVYIYVTICVLAVLGLRALIPYTWLLAITLLAWWGLSLTQRLGPLVFLLQWLSALLAGRDVF